MENITPALSSLLDTTAAAKFLGIAEITLRQQRSQGPRDRHMSVVPYVKMGTVIRYRLQDLAAYVDAHLVSSCPGACDRMSETPCRCAK